MEKEEKYCPRCKLEGIKSILKDGAEDILKCIECNYFESDIKNKITTPFTCPRCALEGIKSDLRNVPNHLLTCGKCQWVGKQVGRTIAEAII